MGRCSRFHLQESPQGSREPGSCPRQRENTATPSGYEQEDTRSAGARTSAGRQEPSACPPLRAVTANAVKERRRSSGFTPDAWVEAAIGKCETE